MSDGTLKRGRPPAGESDGRAHPFSIRLDPDTAAALARLVEEDVDPSITTGQKAIVIRRLIIDEDGRRKRKR